MESNGRRAFHGKNRKFWAALFIFSLMGQVAWVVENMYFNVFIYKMFHATAADISLMVERISDFYRETILPAIPKGVCGCIYTQLSNVEDEVNGLYTYDRKVCKVEKEAMKAIKRKLDETVGQTAV
ncbi:MAG: hypothetical protein HFH92_04290 [Lachnospiraceae bacterium]|uniref:hypothetical protein n=1 Tax=uncultured Acetatifactor sp. TaxID=1671927 RepID=UPI002612D184|nr:hypothetical protein [uncultured Acetatifactor sp.]MCI8788323.1 hypothetical protein [Lachnospiraceae bacterium]